MSAPSALLWRNQHHRAELPRYSESQRGHDFAYLLSLSSPYPPLLKERAELLTHQRQNASLHTRSSSDSYDPFPAHSKSRTDISQILQEVSVTKGGVNYTYLTVKYNTVTRSGYDVERISYIAATVRHRKLFTLAATTSSERRNKMDVDLKRHSRIISSWRRRRGRGFCRLIAW